MNAILSSGRDVASWGGFLACGAMIIACSGDSHPAAGGSPTGSSGGSSGANVSGTDGSTGPATDGSTSGTSGDTGTGSEASGVGVDSSTDGTPGDSGSPSGSGVGSPDSRAVDSGDAGAIVSVDSGGAPANCPSGALLCEDFESFAPMAAPNGKWTSRTNGTATVVVDTMHPHSGTKSVHFHSMPVDNSQRAYILTQGAPVFPVAGDTLYVRFMLYVGRYMSVAGLSIHNRIAWIGSAATLASGGNGPGYAFVTYNGIAVERLTNPNQGFQRDTTQHLDDVARANKWQCLEFEIDNKGGVPPGEQSSSTTLPHIWQEDQELKLAAAGSSEPWVPAPFEALQFSLWCPQTDPMPTDYWIDDIVMSNQRIKCPPAQ